MFLFNSPLSSGCDYVIQTMRIVGRNEIVYGLALGDIISFPRWLTSTNRWIFKRNENAIVVRPISLLPGVRFRFLRQSTYWITALLLRTFLTLTYPVNKKFVWFFEPFHVPGLLSLFAGFVSIYDCVDFFPGFHEQAKREHDVLMEYAKYVFANSHSLAKKLKDVRKDIVKVPLGYADELFHPIALSPILPRKQSLTVGYIGSISNRIDFALLDKSIAQLPDVEFVFVGPIETGVFGSRDDAQNEFKRICSYRNVRWVSYVAKKDIPATLLDMDVGVIPYRADLSFNRFSFPMKVMEYFAVGRPVIATDIVELHDLGREGLIEIIQNQKEFVRAVRKYQKIGWPGVMQRRQKNLARSHSWSNKINAITAHAFGSTS